MDKKLKSGFLSSEVVAAIVLVFLQNAAIYGLIQQVDVAQLAEAIASMVTASIAFVSSASVIIKLIQSRTDLKKQQMQ